MVSQYYNGILEVKHDEFCMKNDAFVFQMMNFAFKTNRYGEGRLHRGTAQDRVRFRMKPMI